MEIKIDKTPRCERERQKIEADVQAYLDSGGEIRVVDSTDNAGYQPIWNGAHINRKQQAQRARGGAKERASLRQIRKDINEKNYRRNNKK